MKVLFDYQAFEMQNMGGVSRSFVELCKELANQNTIVKIGIKESNNVHLKESGLVPNIRPLLHTHDVVFGKQQVVKGQWKVIHSLVSLFGQGNDFRDINLRYSRKLLEEQNFDVFHPTFFDPYFLPYLKKKPFVLTIHDMIPELYPQYYDHDDSQIIGKQILAPLASAIIAVSEKTKEDIIRILHVPEEKVHVIYHGCSFNTPKCITRIIEFPYLLFVGERDGYKNFKLFVKHIAQSLLKHHNLKLVCTGRPFTTQELSLFDSLGIQEKVIQYWVKGDDEFNSLYHHAECFIYPSEYEGFGIPILEAFASNCPVLLNRASCFPEIAAESAIYFTMTEEDSNLSVQLDKLLSMTKEEKAILLQKQNDRLSFFSWQNSSTQLANIYKSIV